MMHTEVIEKYWNNAYKNREDCRKVREYLETKEMLSWSDVIDVLRLYPNPSDDAAVDSDYYNLRLALWENPKFQEQATYAQKRELSMITFGYMTERKEVQAKASRDFLYREDAERVATDDGRKYVLNSGEEFTWPGVTSIWSAVKPFDRSIWIKSLQRKNPDWDMDYILWYMDHVRDTAAARGSAMHEAIELYLADPNGFDLEANCEENGRPYFECMLPLLRYEIDEVISVEPLVWWDLTDIVGHKDAGAIGYIDLVAEHDGKVVLYDWKTADKPKNRQYLDNYFTQVSAYSAMVYQTYGIKVDEARICVAIKGKNYPQMFTLDRSIMKRYIELFLTNVQEYCKQLDEFEAAN